MRCAVGLARITHSSFDAASLLVESEQESGWFVRLFDLIFLT